MDSLVCSPLALTCALNDIADIALNWLQTGSFDWDCCTAGVVRHRPTSGCWPWRSGCSCPPGLVCSLWHGWPFYTVTTPPVDIWHQWCCSSVVSVLPMLPEAVCASRFRPVWRFWCVASHKGLFLARSCLSSILSTSSRWSKVMVYQYTCTLMTRKLMVRVSQLLSTSSGQGCLGAVKQLLAGGDQTDSSPIQIKPKYYGALQAGVSINYQRVH